VKLDDSDSAELHQYYVNKKNLGLSEVRNFGIEKAVGDYIIFLDGDDAYHSESLSWLNKRLTLYQDNVDILFFSAATFLDDTANGEDTYSVSHFVKNKGYERKDIGSHTVKGINWFKEAIENQTYYDASCLILISAKYLKERGIKFIPNLIFEDMLFTRNILINSDNVSVSNDLILLIRKASGSITRSPLNKDKIKSKLYISNYLLKFYRENADVFFYQDSLKIYLTLLREIKKSNELFVFYSFYSLNIYYFLREKIVRRLIYENFKSDCKKIIGYPNNI